MPRLTGDMAHGAIAGGFTYQGTRIDRLGAAEYTLVTIAVDETGSVCGFQDELRDMLIAAVEACADSPRAEYLLVRVIGFGSQYHNGVDELHGFKPLSEIDPSTYRDIRPSGMTPLCDACYSALGAMNAYGQDLVDQDYGVNAVAIVITDGGDNASTATMRMVKDEARKGVSGEVLESMVSVLVGINAKMCSAELAEFRTEAGLTHYVDAGDATKEKLARLAQFVSQTISSQSQALGTGGPSQNISATI